MIKKTIFIVLVIYSFILSGHQVLSQSVRDIRINEVLVFNDSSIVDEYNSRSSWIELFNKAYNDVNIGGCYLTNDRSNPKKFKIPKEFEKSTLEDRGTILFWADNNPSKGNNHLNFTLNENDFLGLYDFDGKLIDSVTLKNQVSNISYGSIEDGSDQKSPLKQLTPNSTNNTKEKELSSVRFKKYDPWGIGMAVIAMSIVFLSLFVLYLFFQQLGLRFQGNPKKKALIKEGKLEEALKMNDTNTGDVYAAIAMALYMYTSEMHDIEEAVLTINKVSRTYSPWSSKIYGLRQIPERRK